jgi:hypothetical protein
MFESYPRESAKGYFRHSPTLESAAIRIIMSLEAHQLIQQQILEIYFYSTILFSQPGMQQE